MFSCRRTTVKVSFVVSGVAPVKLSTVKSTLASLCSDEQRSPNGRRSRSLNPSPLKSGMGQEALKAVTADSFSPRSRELPQRE